MLGNRREALLPGHKESRSKVLGALRGICLYSELVFQG
jgi:hypothetical protein